MDDQPGYASEKQNREQQRECHAGIHNGSFSAY
jgi:hypothetical protein